MAGNTFGSQFKLTTFGESHGKAIGGIIDGCPAGIEIDLAAVQHQLDRRRPGQSSITTRRKESDTVEFLSGLLSTKTLGTPIGFIIPNSDQRPRDYEQMKEIYRPSHADFTYQEKYGIRDHRGGGRSSARETACRVVAGAIAQQILALKGITVTAFVQQIGTVRLPLHYSAVSLTTVDQYAVRCPDESTATAMEAAIKQVQREGDSLGGVIQCVVQHSLTGLGEPVFDRLHADLGKAMLSINAVKGFEYGSGFEAASMKGSTHNDGYTKRGDTVATTTNHSGGIQGGISNGEDIYFNVAFKPVATIFKPQNTVTSSGESVTLSAKGRHDPCVVPRAVPIVESMTALVLLDHLLRAQMVMLD